MIELGGFEAGWRAISSACLARRTTCLVIAAFLVYAVGLGRPKLYRIQELQDEIAELEARRTDVRLGPRSMTYRSEVRDEPTGSRGTLKPRQLVPELSDLGRRVGLRIQAVKQLSDDSDPGVRRLRLVAHGGFAGTVAFLEGVTAVLAEVEVEELTLRHLSEAADIELDSVLRISVEGGAAVRADRSGGG